MPPTPPLVALEREKDQARTLLGDGYARDLITQAELDRRLEALEHATAVAEVQSLTEDLRGHETALAPAHGGRGLAPAPQRIGAVLSSIERKGAFSLRERTDVRVVLGSATLDLRQAELSAGETELRVNVKLGSLDLVVPPGWRIDNQATAFLSAIDEDESARPALPGQRVVRIVGRVVLGALTIHERLPGEGAMAARTRRRNEQKQLAERSSRALPPGEHG
jgi:hypothetical protein